MLLEVTVGEREGIGILDLTGRLTPGQQDLEFRSKLDRLVKAGKIRPALGLGELRKLDTTDLGTPLFALTTLRKAGGNGPQGTGYAVAQRSPARISSKNGVPCCCTHSAA